MHLLQPFLHAGGPLKSIEHSTGLGVRRHCLHSWMSHMPSICSPSCRSRVKGIAAVLGILTYLLILFIPPPPQSKLRPSTKIYGLTTGTGTGGVDWTGCGLCVAQGETFAFGAQNHTRGTSATGTPWHMMIGVICSFIHDKTDPWVEYRRVGIDISLKEERLEIYQEITQGWKTSLHTWGQQNLMSVCVVTLPGCAEVNPLQPIPGPARPTDTRHPRVGRFLSLGTRPPPPPSQPSGLT